MRQLALISTLVIALSTSAAYASEVKVLEKNIEANSFKELVVDVPVGEIDIKVSGNSQIKLVVELEPGKKWVGRRADVSDAEISLREQGTKLKLKVDLEDDKNVAQNWTLAIPAGMAISVNLGVGSVDVQGIHSDIDVDVGIGSITINADTTKFGSIKLDAGVGDTSIKGAVGRYQKNQVLVTSSSKLHGEGQSELEANVGVGDAKVRHSK